MGPRGSDGRALNYMDTVQPQEQVLPWDQLKGYFYLEELETNALKVVYDVNKTTQTLKGREMDLHYQYMMLIKLSKLWKEEKCSCIMGLK